MKKILLVSAVSLALGLGLTGCAPNISPDVVSASSANEVQTAVEGVIVAKHNVTVKGDSNAAGTLAGAVIGALAGSQVGGGNMRYVTGAAGAAGGGVAGNMIQDKLTTQQGIEYVVKLTQEEGSSTTVTTTGQNSLSGAVNIKGKNSSSTTVSSKSAANRYVNVIQGQGQQVLEVGQKVLIAGANSGHAHIIGTL